MKQFLKNKSLSLLERFEERVTKTKKCWVWNGYVNVYGYGEARFKDFGYKLVKAHRLSHLLFKGEIPEGLCIDHLCRNKVCVNPNHLEAVTLDENKRRGYSPPAINSRKTHCPYGHIYQGDNLVTYIRNGNTIRYCKKCIKQSDENRKLK